MKRKIIIIAGVVLALGVFLLVDVYRLGQVCISVTAVSPEEVPAVSTQEVKLSVKAMYKDGRPVTGHSLYAFTLGGGAFKSFYVKTDDNGLAEFIYYPYDLPAYQQPRDVEVEIRDESNSLFVELYPAVKYKIKMIKPETSQKDDDIVDDFLK